MTGNSTSAMQPAPAKLLVGGMTPCASSPSRRRIDRKIIAGRAIARQETTLHYKIAKSFRNPEGSMRAHKLTALIFAAIATATLAAGTAPSEAQAPPVDQTSVKKKPAGTQVATSRPPARVTVRRRSYLDPGTETKARAEHYQDYAFPPGDRTFASDPNDFRINWTRSPFPSCFDLAGFCR
jgi:hypothetical protein